MRAGNIYLKEVKKLAQEYNFVFSGTQKFKISSVPEVQNAFIKIKMFSVLIY